MNYKDVALLNQSLDDLSAGLLKRRMLDQQAREKMGDQLLAQESINVARDRTAAQERHDRSSEALAREATTAGATREELQDKQRFLQTVMALNGSGQIADLNAVNQWLKTDPHFGKVGLQLARPPTPPDPQAGQNALSQALKQADEWRAKATGAGDADLAQQYLGYADKLEKWADVQANPPAKVTPEPRTVTEEIPGPGDTKVRRSYTDAEWEAKQKQRRGKPLTVTEAEKILEEAGWDPAKARALAKERGYAW